MQVFVIEPAFAVSVAVPVVAFGFIVTVVPFVVIVAIEVLLMVHSTFVYELGVTVAVTVVLAPLFWSVVWSLFNDNAVIGFITVNDKLTDLPLPSVAVAVIVAVPAALHVTVTAVPLVVLVFDTVATLVLLEVQFTFLLFALLGPTVAVIVNVSPIFLVWALLGLIDTDVTSWIALVIDSGLEILLLLTWFPATSNMIA